jgi:hypothetical protein
MAVLQTELSDTYVNVIESRNALPVITATITAGESWKRLSIKVSFQNPLLSRNIWGRTCLLRP